MKVLLFVENIGAIAQIRLLRPFEKLQEACVLTCDQYVMDKPRQFDFAQFDKYDVVIFQRTSSPETVNLMRQAQKRNTRVIYDIDDNLLDIPPEHIFFDEFQDSAITNAIRSHLAEADLVTVSTGVLWSALAEFSAHRVVVQNEIDLNLFPPPQAKLKDQVTIAYAGGITHGRDLEPVVPALVELLEEYKSAIRVVLFYLRPASLKKYPQVLHLGGFPEYQQYARLLQEAKIDIGLAPLRDDKFNSAKSDVKYLEYGSQAVAGVYSRSLPYSSVVDGETGLFVEGDDAGMWYDRIKYLIENPEERERMGNNAMLDVRGNRTSDHMAQTWLKTLNNLSASDTVIPAKPVVSIIMLTYNALKYTKECVESIRRHTFYPHEIVFVDNGSKDGTVGYLEELTTANPHYRLIANKTNMGFAAGNNLGVGAARGEYVLMLNNDVLVGPGWLEDLVSSLERHPKIGLVGPLTNHISGRQAIAHVPYEDAEGFYQFSAQVRKAKKGVLTPRRRIAGFALLLRRSLFEQVGGLAQVFGSGNYEDDDLCLRVAELGYAIMVDEGTYLHHYGSQTFTANGIDYAASLKRNEKLFRKRWPDVDHKWLLEFDEPLAESHKAELDKAAVALEGGELGAAETICAQVIRENPLSASAHHGLGLCAHLKGNHDKARSYYQSALQHDPALHPAIKSLARLDLAAGNASDSQIGLLRLLEKDQDDFEARLLLANVLLRQEQFEDAVHLLISITRDDPDDYDGHMTLAALYDELEQGEKVVELMNVVLATRPHDEDAIDLMAKYAPIS